MNSLILEMNVFRFKKNADIDHYRKVILNWFAFSTLLGGFGSFIIGFISQSNYWIFSLVIGIMSGLVLILNYNGKYLTGVSIQLIGSNIAILLQCLNSRSAYLAMFLGLIIIITGIMTNEKFGILVFLVNLIAILIYTSLGIFSWFQEIDPEKEVAYVNNITVLLPFLVICFAASLVISNILIAAIKSQKQQYSRLEKAQDSLIRQQKIKSIQILAGGIAHDFNNLLTAILGNLEVLKMEEGLSDGLADCIKEAKDAALQARNLTNQLLSFSRNRQTVKKKLTELGQIIKDTARFSIRGRKSRLKFEISDDLSAIKADENQISQVIQNLIINADEAMQKGKRGLIFIKAQNELDPDIPPNISKSGPYVHISVRDNGVGIPKELQDKLFEPYFSTKSEGTGLGLPISYSIITKHDGYLGFESEVGRGTTFHIYLPAIKGAHVAPKKNAPKKKEYQGQVYILDDEENILLILSKLLGRLGFQTKTFSKGEHLLENLKKKYSSSTEKIPDFIIMDLTIPGHMGGIQVAKEIQKLDEKIPLVLSSGYSMEDSDESLISKHLGGLLDYFLPKPYTRDDIIRMLDELGY